MTSRERKIKKFLKFREKNNLEEILSYPEKYLELIERYIDSNIFISSKIQKFFVNNFKLQKSNKKLIVRLQESARAKSFMEENDIEFLDSLFKFEKELIRGNVTRQNFPKFLERIGYNNIKDDDIFQEFIKNLDIEHFYELIYTFNMKFRNMDVSKKEYTRKDLRKVGTWRGASNEVINSVFPKLLSSLKKLTNRREQAALMYYSIVLMHPFENGNGRTSRFIFDAIMGSDIESNLDWYFHGMNDEELYDDRFELSRNLMLVEDLEKILLHKNAYNITKYIEFLPQELVNKSIEVNVLEVPIREDIRKQLSRREQDLINHLIGDNTLNHSYEVGGLIMLIMSSYKGELNKWISLNEDYYHFVFDIDKHPEMLDLWTIDDYRKVIEIGNDIKKEIYLNLIDIFVNSNNYKIGDQLLKNLIINPNKLNNNKRK